MNKILLAILTLVPSLSLACSMALPDENNLKKYTTITHAKVTNILDLNKGYISTKSIFTADINVVKNYQGCIENGTNLKITVCGSLPEENEQVLLFLDDNFLIPIFAIHSKYFDKYLTLIGKNNEL